MVLMCFAKFRVKGLHWYRDKYTVGEELELIMETYNVVSKYKRKTIEITKGLEKRRQKLEKKKDVHRCELSILDIFLMRGGVSVNIQMQIFKSDLIIDRKHKVAPEKLRVPGGNKEIKCTYFLYGAKCYKEFEKNKRRECQNELI